MRTHPRVECESGGPRPAPRASLWTVRRAVSFDIMRLDGGILILILVCSGALPRGHLPTLSQAGFASASPYWIASAHRGTGVAVVLLTHPRVLLSHTHGLTGLSV